MRLGWGDFLVLGLVVSKPEGSEMDAVPNTGGVSDEHVVPWQKLHDRDNAFGPNRIRLQRIDEQPLHLLPRYHCRRAPHRRMLVEERLEARDELVSITPRPMLSNPYLSVLWSGVHAVRDPHLCPLIPFSVRSASTAALSCARSIGIRSAREYFEHVAPLVYTEGGYIKATAVSLFAMSEGIRARKLPDANTLGPSDTIS